VLLALKLLFRPSGPGLICIRIKIKRITTTTNKKTKLRTNSSFLVILLVRFWLDWRLVLIFVKNFSFGRLILIITSHGIKYTIAYQIKLNQILNKHETSIYQLTRLLNWFDNFIRVHYPHHNRKGQDNKNYENYSQFKIDKRQLRTSPSARHYIRLFCLFACG
jgi:hypothetical protein